MVPSPPSVILALDFFTTHNIKISDLVHCLLTDPSLPHHLTSIFLDDLRHGASTMVSDLLRHAKGTSQALKVNEDLFSFVSQHIREEIKDLILHGTEWQFGASSAKSVQLESFQLEKMAKDIADTSPRLWSFLDVFLSATQKTSPPSQYSGVGIEEEQYWEEMDDFDLEGIIEMVTAKESARELRLARRRQVVLTIKKVVIISIIMQSTNQKTNAIPSLIGIFLHSCKTPEKVVEVLARLGISISINAIHNAITSLSAESANRIRSLGQSLLINYAYDNFDVNLKTSVPTIDKSAISLKHLTSGLIFPLQHGVTMDDMKCSEYLWKRSPLNIYANPSDITPTKSWKDVIDRLRNIHPEPNLLTKNGLTRREQFNSWKFLCDLVDYGPTYFSQFRDRLQPPETIEPIPILKTEITPVRSMEFSNSTVSGNISTILNLMDQGGIGDPSDPDNPYEVKDATPYVILFHGDLGTGDRILSHTFRKLVHIYLSRDVIHPI
ncbi:hypothetical protein H0H93_010587 [Arthromyces matolae]|nr:hypothetical protein H0H93_010587 [Arthromyces matolae]